jgi:signal recognition particle subunit SRP54
MTKRERLDPDIFLRERTRITRVARGAGRQDKDVVDLLQRFSFMRQMMGDIGQQAGLLAKIPGLKQLAHARRLQDAVRTTGLETNPMMSTLADQLLEAAVASGGKDGGQMAQLAQMLQRGGGMPGGLPGMGGIPGGFPGLGLPGMGGPPQRAALKQSEKDKKKQQRKQEKKARKKSRK